MRIGVSKGANDDWPNKTFYLCHSCTLTRYALTGQHPILVEKHPIIAI